MTELESNGLDRPTEQLKAENRELRKLLFEQWETNHHEHCGAVGEHDDCYWPLPEILTPPRDTNPPSGTHPR